MFKEKYKKIIQKIEPEPNLIKDTINKINNKQRKVKNKSIYFKLVNAIALILIIFTAFWVYSVNEPQIEPNPDLSIDMMNSTIPTLGSFENLKKIAKKIDRTTRKEIFVTDSIMQESSNENLSTDLSKTNTQVEEVDESDIVKVDENYVYYVVGNSKIVIVDVSNPTDIKLSYEIDYKENFRPDEIYLKDNKLIVIGTSYVVDNKEQEKINRKIYIRKDQYTKAIVYDITNRTNVQKLREIEIEGSCISTRMIDNNIYIASNKWLYSNNILDSDTNEYELKPEYRDTNISDEYKKINYDCIYCFPEAEELNYLILASFNIYDNKEANIQTYLGGGQNIYCSENNMYVVKSKYQYETSILNTIIRTIALKDSSTEIYKFALINGNIAYKGKGEVKGTIINQFAMDEEKGYFRIATTSFIEDNKTANNVYVLDESLNIVGKLENLAIGESIYSVRFMQNKCYMVTFEQVDPLFVIDLSNPLNPQVLGELKIPGYSRYLHPYDQNHIIGIGEDTEIIEDRYGTRVVTTGMKMALFDVSDVNNPKELYSTKIGEAGTYSEILYNHKALLFSKEKNIISFPIYITSKEDVTSRQNLTFQGAIIYGLNFNSGFELKGKISHMEIENSYQNYDYYKAVKRIVYINDTLITLSDELIKTSNINTLEELDSITLTIEEDNNIYRE